MKVRHRIDETIAETDVLVSTTTEQQGTFKQIRQLLVVMGEQITVLQGSGEREALVPLRAIVTIESEGNNCHVVLQDKTLGIIAGRLKDVESKLEKHRYFLKINKVTLINIYHVKEFSMVNNFRIELIMKNGYTQTVNRTFTKEFKERLEEILI